MELKVSLASRSRWRCPELVEADIRPMKRRREPPDFASAKSGVPQCYGTAVQAALRFTLLSAMAVSFLSAAFSSSRFCCSKVAQSLLPSSFAQAIKLP